MSGFTINNDRIVSYEGDEKTLTIPAGITRIGTGAFKGKNIEQIIFEDGTSLKSIDDEAFAGCKELKSMLIPYGVVQIGDRAFSGCNSLQYIRIPSSVILVGEDVLFGHSSDLVIIGEKGTEAETIATKYGITLQGDEQRAINAVQAAAKGKSSVETRSFEILGETITCSNTLAKYQEAIEYYASRKKPFFASYIEMFPTDLNFREPNVDEVFESEMDRTVDRLAKQGVLKTREAIRNKYLLEPYTMTVDGLKAILNLQKDASENAISNMSSMKENLAREAESKVTGLSYGVIGDGLDLLAYSIDDFAERQRQREKAYAEADRKYDQYKRNQRNQCDKLIADAMKEIMPTLRQLSNLIIEKLLEAEIDLLTDAGIIEENATKGIDIQKSAQLIQSVIGKRNDNTFTAVLAIKKYPCNVAALTYAYEHNPSCTELKDLIQFLGMSNQVDKSLSDSKQSRLKSYISELKNVSTASQGFDLIQKEIALFSDDEIKKLLDCVAQAITPKIQEIALGEKPNVITDTKEYCTIELNKILTQNDWDYFESHGVSPIATSKIPRDSITSHSLLLEWLSSKLSEMTVRNQKYDKYLEKYPLKKEEARIRSELKTVQEKISKLQTKTSEQEIVSVLKRLFGVILIIGGIILCVVVNSDEKDPFTVVYFLMFVVPGLLVFLSVYMPPKGLRALRKEEKVLTAKMSEISKLPPFIEDDKKQKDAEAKAEAERLECERQAKETSKKRIIKITLGITIPVVCIAFAVVLFTFIIPNSKYNSAVALYDAGNYEEAINAFTALNGYKDSAAQIEKCQYNAAVALYDAGNYEEAINAFTELNGYKDSAAQIEKCVTAINDKQYNAAVALYDAGNYEEAINVFTALNGYKDSAAQIEKCAIAINDKQYNAAVSLYDAGKYEEAINAFTALNGYKNSEAMIKEIKPKYHMQLISDSSVGSRVLWGSYEQDNNTSNGKEDIEWIVLAREDDRVLVISQYALDCKQYNTSRTSVTWETCSLRKWLNGTFLNAAFSESERDRIPIVTVRAEKNLWHGTSAGKSTKDQVFLLSITEVKKHFGWDAKRQCQGTAFCYAQGGFKAKTSGNCTWWLRSPGRSSYFAAGVFSDGSIDGSGGNWDYGMSVDNDHCAVRPALWINLGS